MSRDIIKLIWFDLIMAQQAMLSYHGHESEVKLMNGFCQSTSNRLTINDDDDDDDDDVDISLVIHWQNKMKIAFTKLGHLT